jgi:hypothetical protein
MIGNVIITLMLPAFNRVQAASDREEQVQRNLNLAFLLAAHLRDHGKYPEKLDQVAANYHVAIPNDLFSREPLIYRRAGNGYLLYSVGPNGIDEEGRGANDEPRGDDLSVRMPVPKPRKKNSS